MGLSTPLRGGESGSLSVASISPIWTDPLGLLLIGTVFFAGFVAGILWARSRLEKWLSKMMANKTKKIESIHLRRLGLQQIVVLVRGVLHWVSVVMLAIAAVSYTHLTLPTKRIV